jgi:hypothetical protein
MAKGKAQGRQEKEEKCKCGHGKNLHTGTGTLCKGYTALDRLCWCMKFVPKSKSKITKRKV